MKKNMFFFKGYPTILDTPFAMETFMMGLPNGEVYMDEYLLLRNHASDVQTNGYALIRRWFVAQFPDFRKNPMAYIHTQPEVIHANEFAEMAENEMEKVA